MDLPIGTMELLLKLIENQAQLIDLKNHLHGIETFDPVTQLLNRSTMVMRLNAEVVRARRIQLPLSLVIISLDQYRELLSEYGMDEAGIALRAIGKIIQPRSRVNDTLGRFGPEELALILPHTTCQGGAIKAERIRRLIAAADFSQLLPKYPKLTVSIGVSEYPSTCRDGEDLVATADDALWQIKNKVSNKVCVATPVSGFVPDFQVNG
jgi:diguanylate cyclase (GGDEF)-like protein